MPQDSSQTTSPTTSSSSLSSSQKAPGGDTAPAAGAELTKAKDALVEGAQHLKTELKSAAGDAADQAKKAAETKLDAGRDFAAEHLGSVADALRKTGNELRSSDSPLTDYMASAASSVDKAAYYLQTRTLSHVLGDLEGFARREPAMFLGGSFIAGILSGRFLKSAAPASGSSKSGPSRGTAAGAQRSQSAQMLALPEYGSTRSAGGASTSSSSPYSPTPPTTPMPASKAGSTEQRAGAMTPSEDSASSSLQGRTNGTRNGSTSTAVTPGTR